MVLHPSGGSVEHIINISTIIIVAHSIALLAMPFLLLGFWGLTLRIGKDDILSVAAFIIMGVGILAAICAAAINGLALPLFLQHYRDASPEVIASIKPIVKYNTSLNHAFDFIYIAASVLAILFWSTRIIQANRLAKWLGWMGLVICIMTVFFLIAGFVFTNVSGFRIFILALVVWVVAVAVDLIKVNSNK